MTFVRLMCTIGMLVGFLAGPAQAQAVKVFVSIAPHAHWVEQIGGDPVAVSVMLEPGDNPHTYEPTPRQMVAVSEADIYFRSGVPFEAAWMDRLKQNADSLQVVDLREGIELRDMEDHLCLDHDHHHHHEHGAGGNKDPHTWLSPLKAKQQAETIAAALQEADPSHAEDYERNLKAFQERLQALHEDIAEQLADLEHRRFLVYHPAWGYFADAYGLEQVPIEIEGKEPTARQLAQIIDYAKEQGIKAIFVQQQFSRKTGQAIASAIGGEVIAIDPLARNYFENLRTIAQRLAEALR